MSPDDYRERGRQCREAAGRSAEPVKSDFLEAATTWDQLADQLERLARAAPGATDADRTKSGRPLFVYYIPGT